MLACSAVTFAAHDTDGLMLAAQLFDSDSGEVGIDNCCSGCMSNRRSDFVGPLCKTDKIVKGFAGSRMTQVCVGTLRWHFEDDDGKVTTFLTPNSCCVPDGGVRLLSPQHWAKHFTKAQHPAPGKAPEETFHDRVVLNWSAGKSTRTAFLDEVANVATLLLTPGCNKFNAFCTEIDANDKEDFECPLCVECDDAEVVSNDEELVVFDASSERVSPRQTSFDFMQEPHATGPKPVIIEDEEDLQRANDAAELLQLHHKFGHCSFRKLQMMAQQGVPPKHLTKCHVPICTACFCGKQTKCQWRHRHADNWADACKPSKPGEVVSVDQMISPTGGLIAQMSGNLTEARHKVAAVFVDQCSGCGCVHLQKSSSADETLEAKAAFEQKAQEAGITVRHCHADNGVFAANAWRASCFDAGQGLSFAGANVHHQNGKAECHIRSLQELARMALSHAHQCWPSAITANLWPHPLSMANASLNATPSLQDKAGHSPQEMFCRTDMSTNPKHWQPCLCPACILRDELQSQGICNKWKERSRVGMYLGRLPQHAQNVAPVLNLQTGHVSPQFHVSFDPSFQMIKSSFGGQLPESLWQEKAGFLDKPAAAKQKSQHKSGDQEGGRTVHPASVPMEFQPEPASEPQTSEHGPEPAQNPHQVSKNQQESSVQETSEMQPEAPADQHLRRSG